MVDWEIKIIIIHQYILLSVDLFRWTKHRPYSNEVELFAPQGIFKDANQWAGLFISPSPWDDH